MVAFTLKPAPVTSPPSSLLAEWGDAGAWVQGAVPNSSDADVALADPSAGNAAVFIRAGQAFTARSVGIAASWLELSGALNVVDAVNVSAGTRIDGIQRNAGQLYLDGGTLTAGSIVNGNLISGRGQVLVNGTLTNDG